MASSDHPVLPGIRLADSAATSRLTATLFNPFTSALTLSLTDPSFTPLNSLFFTL